MLKKQESQACYLLKRHLMYFWLAKPIVRDQPADLCRSANFAIIVICKINAKETNGI